MNNLKITREMVVEESVNRYISLFNLKYEEGKGYYDASRRQADDLVAIMSEEEFKSMLPDAVSCIVVIKTPNEEPRLLLSYEYRYPVGRYVLGVPAGLIDPEDLDETRQKLEENGIRVNEDALREAVILSAASRELHEETGIVFNDETDEINVVNPCAFSTPGMSDESNALVSIVVELKDLSSLDQSGAVGQEMFDGFALLTKEQAMKVFKEGRDEHGYFYSMYTWAALIYFISGLCD